MNDWDDVEEGLHLMYDHAIAGHWVTPRGVPHREVSEA